MADLTLEKILSAVEMCKAHDDRERQAFAPYHRYQLAFMQVRVLEKAGQDINPILDCYGNVRELHNQWKKEMNA
jgi:hypothetical protein